MDDLVIVEPDLGIRAVTSLGMAEALITKIFGKRALNQDKDLVEGLLETEKLTWGLLYDTTTMTRRLPEPKLEKAAFLLGLVAFDWGN